MLSISHHPPSASLAALALALALSPRSCPVLSLVFQVRDLSEMNMVLRSQMDRGRGSGRAMTKDSVESNSTLGDAVHPEQVSRLETTGDVGET